MRYKMSDGQYHRA